jgi:hypothetical protein
MIVPLVPAVVQSMMPVDRMAPNSFLMGLLAVNQDPHGVSLSSLSAKRIRMEASTTAAPGHAADPEGDEDNNDSNIWAERTKRLFGWRS